MGVAVSARSGRFRAANNEKSGGRAQRQNGGNGNRRAARCGGLCVHGDDYLFKTGHIAQLASDVGGSLMGGDQLLQIQAARIGQRALRVQHFQITEFA